MYESMEEFLDSLNVGKGISDLRKRIGYSLLEVSNRSGVSLSDLKQIEAGEIKPTKEVLEIISDALGIPSSSVIVCSVEEDSLKDLPPKNQRMIKMMQPVIDMLLDELVNRIRMENNLDKSALN